MMNLTPGLSAYGLSAFEAQISAALKPVIYLTLTPETPSPDGHRLGGLPYLPNPEVWPQELPEDEDDEEDLGYRKDFLLQLRLDALPELPDHPLPRTGWLLFFIGNDAMASDIGMKVLHLPALGNAPTPVPGRTPESESDNFSGLVPQALHAQLGWALPRWDSRDFRLVTAGMTEDETLTFGEFARTLEPSGCVGSLFGYARAFDPEYLEYVEGMPLLLHLNSVHEAELSFWGGGLLSVYSTDLNRPMQDFSGVLANILTS